MIETQSTTFLTAIAPKDLSPSLWRRFLSVAAECAAFTLVAFLLVARWRGSESGVIAMVLSAAPITTRIKALLDENRERVYASPSNTRPANLLTVISVLGAFAGSLLAFVGATIVFGPEDIRERFAFVAETTGVASALSAERFGSLTGLLAHNFGVFATVLILGIVYRAFGVALVLVWNACAWGIVLTLLTMRSMEESELSQLLFASAAAVALLPHLFLEALAYVLAGLAATFMSIAVVKYKLSDQRMRSVARSSGRLLAAAVLALIAAAAVESILPRLVLRALS